MTEKIILDISHSDDYTDYLFQTAALRNKRITPLVNPSGKDIQRLSVDNTLVVHCDSFRRDADKDGRLTTYEYLTDTIHVFSKSYLSDDGAIDYAIAEQARAEIEEHLINCLTGPINQQDAFRENFPLLWKNRKLVYETPRFFYVQYANGDCGYPIGSIVYLGAVLKAIETHPESFRYDSSGGCACAESPILISYQKTFKKIGERILHTWCPACNARRAFITEDRPAFYACDHIIERTNDDYVTGVGFSELTILDVIDELKDA